MNIQILNNLKNVHRLSQADLARMARVSRAAVCKWFHHREKTGWANVETNTLLKLAKSLHVDPGLFLSPPILWDETQARFLWDALYPDMESFVSAINQARPQALARLVQVLGFHESLLIAGKKTVTLFEKYKKYLKPARRKELETLWPIYASQI